MHSSKSLYKNISVYSKLNKLNTATAMIMYKQ